MFGQLMGATSIYLQVFRKRVQMVESGTNSVRLKMDSSDQAVASVKAKAGIRLLSIYI